MHSLPSKVSCDSLARELASASREAILVVVGDVEGRGAGGGAKPVLA